MKKINITILFLLSGFIINCGFHLRSDQNLSAVLPEVQIQGINKHSELGRELINSLTIAKVNVLDESNSVLTITRDNMSKRVLSVDSAGQANQYELSYQVDFFLGEKVKGESLKHENKNLVTLAPIQSIIERREYLFDSDLVLAKVDEENRLKSDMRQAAISQLIRRLHFILKKNKIEFIEK